MYQGLFDGGGPFPVSVLGFPLSIHDSIVSHNAVLSHILDHGFVGSLFMVKIKKYLYIFVGVSACALVLMTLTSFLLNTAEPFLCGVRGIQRERFEVKRVKCY